LRSLASLLLLLGLFELEALLRHTHELFSIELLEQRNGVFVDEIDEQEDFFSRTSRNGELRMAARDCTFKTIILLTHDDVLAVVHDEDTADVELHVVTLLLCLEELRI